MFINGAEITDQKPFYFSSQVEVSACYIEIENKFLVLQRASHKSEPEKWGIPGGKLEKQETPQDAAIRELFEETGISVSASQVEHLNSLYIKKPDIDYIYHSFKIHLDQIPEVYLSNEHQDYRWVSIKELNNLPVLSGTLGALTYYFNRK